ncbi:MAG: hypothetical protein BJ554DRAFT_3444, partial [Olpidium bornovanus]
MKEGVIQDDTNLFLRLPILFEHIQLCVQLVELPFRAFFLTRKPVVLVLERSDTAQVLLVSLARPGRIRLQGGTPVELGAMLAILRIRCCRSTGVWFTCRPSRIVFPSSLDNSGPGSSTNLP